jgi:hypothetical protein
MNNVAFVQILGPPTGTVLVFVFLIIFYPVQPKRELSHDQAKLRRLLTLFLFLGVLFIACIVGLVAAVLAWITHVSNDVLVCVELCYSPTAEEG